MASRKLKRPFKIMLLVFFSIAIVVFLFNVFNFLTDSASFFLGNALNGTNRAEVLKDVPKKFHKNYFFKTYGLGECESMVGDICVTFVFVDDDLSKWSQDEISNYKIEPEKILSQIETDSKKFNAVLNLPANYKTATSSGKLTLNNYMNWVKKAIASAGLPEFSRMGAKLEQQYGVDNAPVIFLVNRNGRCFAKPSTTKQKGEFAIVYNDADSFYHEFCHIFGGVDFYYPNDVKNLADKNLPESIMNANGKKVDDLTAYLIGWTKTLSDGATTVLEGTNHLPEDYLRQQHADETRIN